MITKIHIQKRHGLKWYNLRCPHCGTDNYKLYSLLRLKFLMHGEASWHFHCPHCHKTTAKKMMFNIVNDHTDKDERIMNGKKLWDDRIK